MVQVTSEPPASKASGMTAGGMMPRSFTVFFHGRVGASTVSSSGSMALPPPPWYVISSTLVPVTSYVTS